MRGSPGRATWIQIDEKTVPDGIRFSVPGANQGQIIEVAYGTFDRCEADSSDPYKRVIDRSTGSVTYYHRAP